MKLLRTVRALGFALMPMTLMACWCLPADAGVTRIEIKSRTDVLDGKPWGESGPYERIIGTVHFTVDPANPHNKTIPNIEKAPRNAQGLVEFSSDIYILAPKDQSKGNGVAFFEVPNRGDRGLMGEFDRAPRRAASGEEEFGDGLLLRSGYTLVWVGWQFSVDRKSSLIGIDLPIAMDNGQPVTGRVNAPFTVNTTEPTVALDPDTSRYPPVSLASPDATLTVRENVYDTPRVIARDQWQFAKLVDGKVIPDGASLYMKNGFQAGQTYELSYTAKNTPVGGLGYTALRDVGAAFRKPGALVSAKYEYAFGVSQTGRFVREFIYDGFNADEQGHKVFDAMWAHISGAARGDFAEPFSLPNGLGIFTGSMFPYSDTPQRDPVTGKTDGMLMHMSKDVIPKIIYSNSDCEYWGSGRAAALLYTTLDGKKEEKVPDNVRIYMMASAQHGPVAFPPASGVTQQKQNPNDYWWAMRAILVGLDGWVRQGNAPPPSRYPKLSDGTLVAHDSFRFPAIPGVQSPSIIPGGYRADLGGPTSPRIPFLVPQVDADGNDMGGIRMPDVAVPLATYTGWNFRSPSIGAPTEIVPLTGSFVPFAAKRSQREQNHDPRLSIEERYASRDAYLTKVREAAQKLAAERYLLPQDVEPLVDHASVVWDNLTGESLKSEKMISLDATGWNLASCARSATNRWRCVCGGQQAGQLRAGDRPLALKIVCKLLFKDITRHIVYLYVSN